MATNEIASALERGIIDGAENNPIFYVTNKHVQHAKHWSWTRHQFGVDALLASKRWMSGQPTKVQDAVRAAGRQAQTREHELWKAATSKYVAEAAKDGAKMVEDVDRAAFRAALRPLYDKYRKTYAELMPLLSI
jgi:TRAP-type C4-dicarboxylate transport system substrate-binding protein